MLSNQIKPLTIRRLPKALEQTGKSRSAFYEDVKQRLWTKPISLGSRAIGWPAHEVDALVGARIAGKSESEIRALVLRLETSRAALAVE